MLQAVHDKEKEIWIPAFDGNFDDDNNLDLYEVVKEVESYTLMRMTIPIGSSIGLGNNCKFAPKNYLRIF